MTSSVSWRALAAAALLAGLSTTVLAAEVLPKPDVPFGGVIDADRNKSSPIGRSL